MDAFWFLHPPVFSEVIPKYLNLSIISIFWLPVLHISVFFSSPPFLAYFPKKESEAYEITSLSVCPSVCTPNNFWTNW
jgi:hypothetical protein